MPYENSCCNHFFDRMGGEMDTVRVSHNVQVTIASMALHFIEKKNKKKKEMKMIFSRILG